MSNLNRVFITGRSALTSTGVTAEENWDALLAGKSGIRDIQEWDLSNWPCKLGAELKEYQPSKMLPDRKLAKVISKQDVMGIYAAVQAVEDSQMISFRDTLDSQESFNDQTAIYVGSPGNKYVQQYDFLPLLAKTKGDMQLFAQELFNEVHPMWLLRILPNNVLAYTGITYGFKGPNHNITNHAAGGAQALLEAYHAIQTGQAERAVVVAYDMGVEPQALFYYQQLGVLSNEDLKPFDLTHNGTVLADGAAALILESEASVRARSAVCYGEVLAGQSASEASGLFSIEASGQQLTELLERTLQSAELTVEDMGLIVAHGNGNPKSDNSEAEAITALLGDAKVPVTGFKWSMGHTLCASGVVDAVLSSYAMQHRTVPGIANLKASTHHGLGVSQYAQPMNTPYAMLINRGFASMNVCLILKACHE